MINLKQHNWFGCLLETATAQVKDVRKRFRRICDIYKLAQSVDELDSKPVEDTSETLLTIKLTRKQQNFLRHVGSLDNEQLLSLVQRLQKSKQNINIKMLLLGWPRGDECFVRLKKTRRHLGRLITIVKSYLDLRVTLWEALAYHRVGPGFIGAKLFPVTVFVRENYDAK